MNILTIAILVVCATAAYASALPEPRPAAVEAAPVAAAAEDIFEGAESRNKGGGYHGYHHEYHRDYHHDYHRDYHHDYHHRYHHGHHGK